MMPRQGVACGGPLFCNGLGQPLPPLLIRFSHSNPVEGSRQPHDTLPSSAKPFLLKAQSTRLNKACDEGGVFQLRTSDNH